MNRSILSQRDHRNAHACPLCASAIYFGVCIGWILFSDRLLAMLGLPMQMAYWVGTLKGAGFVLVTSVLLYVLLRRNNEQIRKAHEANLRASMEIAHRLAHAIELRDVCTSEHNERIAGYCLVLGREMGLDSFELDRLVRAAPLHDVGKIAIPDSVLQKPGPLTADELSLVRQHAMFGAELLRAEGNDFMDLASTIARTHHESWDGTGYPIGLRKDEIPLEGRIVAICDVFDALLSERPYKRAWAFDEAVAEIVRLSGTKFDPEVVRAFQRAVPTLERTFNGVSDDESEAYQAVTAAA